VGQHLSFVRAGKATDGESRSELDWGKPTVRDRRGACGNVDYGGTRTPPRVSKERVLETLRLTLCAPQIYPDLQWKEDGRHKTDLRRGPCGSALSGIS
jgi:hypothetical protein